MQQIKKMGRCRDRRDDARDAEGAEERRDRRRGARPVEAIIRSMTPAERRARPSSTDRVACASPMAAGRPPRRSTRCSSSSRRCRMMEHSPAARLGRRTTRRRRQEGPLKREMAVKLRLMRMGKKKQPPTGSWPRTAARPGTAGSSRSWAPTSRGPTLGRADRQRQGGQLAEGGRPAHRDRGEAAAEVRRLGRVQGGQGQRPETPGADEEVLETEAAPDVERPTRGSLARAVLDTWPRDRRRPRRGHHRRRGGPPGRRPAALARLARRHGRGHRPAWPGGSVDQHPRAGRRRPRGYRGHVDIVDWRLEDPGAARGGTRREGPRLAGEVVVELVTDRTERVAPGRCSTPAAASWR